MLREMKIFVSFRFIFELNCFKNIVIYENRVKFAQPFAYKTNNNG